MTAILPALISLVVALSSAIGSVAVGGTATWYCSDGRDGSRVSDCTRGYGPDDAVAAIDVKDTPFRVGDIVEVSGPAGVKLVEIVDECLCGGSRIIDLPIGIFEDIAGDWRPGRVRVTLEGGRVVLPPTDTE